MENNNKCVFSIFVAPWQETFADARDGNGGGDHFGIILDPFGFNFKTILGSHMPTYYFFQPSLLASSPLFDKDHPATNLY